MLLLFIKGAVSKAPLFSPARCLLLSKINHQHIDCYENQDFKSFAVMKARHSELCKNLMDPVNFINIKSSMKFM